MIYLWLKAFHLIAMVSWFAGIFYLPRLFVYHAQTDDALGKERFKVMERKLYRGIMTPSMVVTLLLGIAMLITPTGQIWLSMGWLWVKLFFVALVVAYHFWCGQLIKAFVGESNQHSHIWYRWFNEAPVIALIIITLMVVVKPF